MSTIMFQLRIYTYPLCDVHFPKECNKGKKTKNIPGKWNALRESIVNCISEVYVSQIK